MTFEKAKDRLFAAIQSRQILVCIVHNGDEAFAERLVKDGVTPQAAKFIYTSSAASIGEMRSGARFTLLDVTEDNDINIPAERDALSWFMTPYDPSKFRPNDDRGYRYDGDGKTKIVCPSSIQALQDTVLVMVDFYGAPSVKSREDDPITQRLIIDGRQELSSDKKTIIFFADSADRISGPLRQHMDIIELDPPDDRALAKVVEGVADINIKSEVGGRRIDVPPIEKTPEAIGEVVAALRGLPWAPLTAALRLSNRASAARCMGGIESGKDLPKSRRFDIPMILEKKAQFVSSVGIEELVPDPAGMGGMGGYDILKRDMEGVMARMSPDAIADGAERSKGILLVGPGGTGKSRIAKCVAAAMNRPLYMIDIGACKNKFVGDSGRNLRRALAAASSMAPIVLLVDEFNRAWSGAGSGLDSGVSDDMMAAWLWWSQENTRDVFLIGSANSVEEMPSPMLRSGRWSRQYFAGLPGEGSREQIFSVHLAKRGWDPENFDLGRLARCTEGFTGAEIEHAVSDGIEIKGTEVGWGRDKPLTSDHIERAASGINPMSAADLGDIVSVTRWAIKSGVRMASSDTFIPQSCMPAGAAQAKKPVVSEKSGRGSEEGKEEVVSI